MPNWHPSVSQGMAPGGQRVVTPIQQLIASSGASALGGRVTYSPTSFCQDESPVRSKPHDVFRRMPTNATMDSSPRNSRTRPQQQQHQRQQQPQQQMHMRLPAIPADVCGSPHPGKPGSVPSSQPERFGFIAMTPPRASPRGLSTPIQASAPMVVSTPSPRAAKCGSPRSPRIASREIGEEGGREEVKVVVRIRPPIEPSASLAYCADEADPTKLLGAPLEVCSVGQGAPRSVSVEELEFSRVVGPREDNCRVFDALGIRDLIAGVAQGYQETIFAYGQTGSGKTHTILGSAGGEPGLLQLCTTELLNLFTSISETRRYIQLTCLEIKNDDIFDLLPDKATVEGDKFQSNCQDAVPLLEPSMHETISVKGRRTSYRKVAVWSFDEAMWLLRGAVASREVGSSTVNSESSRSHMVVRFTVKSFATGATDFVAGGVSGSLTLVDLAGNERESSYDVGSASAVRKGEAKAINLSLTHLNRMLVKMQNGQLDESDRRQCTLNMVLYESLVEECGVTMVFCIHPDRRYALSARSTLQMALRCRRIVRKKRVRCIEAGKYYSELADLRTEADALTRAHREAREEQMRKEEELRDTAGRLDELRLRYEEKSKDYETLFANLKVQYCRLSQEEMEKQRMVVDLGRKNELVSGLIEQLQEKDTAYADLQRRYEEACSGKEPNRVFNDRTAAITNASERSAADASASETDDRCKELERAHRDELRAVRASYEKQLRNLQEALQWRESVGCCSAATGNAKAVSVSTAGDTTPSSAAKVSRASLPPSVGESCSEPSVYSTRTDFGYDDAGAAASSGGVSTVGSVESATANDRWGRRTQDDFVIVDEDRPEKKGFHKGLKPVASPQRAGSRLVLSPMEAEPTRVEGEPALFLVADEPEAEGGCQPRPTNVMAGVATAVVNAAIAEADCRIATSLPHVICIDRKDAKEFVSNTPDMQNGDTALQSRHKKLPKGERVIAQLEALLGPSSIAVSADIATVRAAENALAQLCRAAFQNRIEPAFKLRCVALVIEALHRFPSSLRVLRDGAKAIAEFGNKDASVAETVISGGSLSLVINALWEVVAAVEPAERPDAIGGGDCGDEDLSFGAQGNGNHLIEKHVASEACSSCFRLLAVLCQRHRSNQVAVRKLGGIHVALRLLATSISRHGEEVAVHGCWFLMALCHNHRENQQIVQQQGGAAILLALLSAEVGALPGSSPLHHSKTLDKTRVVTLASATLCAYIAGCIASVAEGCRSCQQAFYDAGGVAVLLCCLNTCLQSPHVVTNTCIALAHVAHRHEPSQEEARVRGCGRSILGALLAYRGQSAVQVGICRAIAVLVEALPSNQEAFLVVRMPDRDSEVTAVSLLVQALSSPQQDETLATTACWALANLLVGSADALNEVRQVRGLHVAVSLLRRFSSEERPCEYLCRLIAALCRSDATAHRNSGTPTPEACARLAEAALRNRKELQLLGAPDSISAVAEIHALSPGFVLVHARDALQLLGSDH